MVGAESVPAVAGESFTSLFSGDNFVRSMPLFWEHLGWRAVRDGNWKAIFSPQNKRWSLYNLTADPTEQQDLAEHEEDRLKELVDAWQTWSQEVGTAGFDSAAFMKYYQPRPAQPAK